ncbi:hypothetical protein GCM10028807_17310 [Spirosoma daeguense]
MVQPKQTLATFLATFFGQSEKVISEKLDTAEHNQFTSEAGELQKQVTALENEKATLETEKATLATEKSTLETAKTTLEGEKTTLQNSLAEMETDRDKYKAWFEKQAGAGAQLPDADATSKGESDTADYNQGALEFYRRSKGN